MVQNIVTGILETFCERNGMIHQTTNVYTPQQNGVAERMNRTIVERAKCMIFDAKLDKSYWAEAVNTAVYVINRSINSILVDNTPEGIWTGSKVNLSNIRIFGSPVMVNVPKQRRQKWDKKAKKMIFVGYSSIVKGYRCLDPVTKTVTTSRDVTFMETQPQVADNVIIVTNDDSVSVGDNLPTQQVPVEEIVNEEAEIDEDADDASDEYFIPNRMVTPPVETRHSSRIPKPKKLDDYIIYAACASDFGNDPITLGDALSGNDGENWKIAIKDELQSLEENDTWSLVDLPKNRKSIKCKWVFKTKCDDDGNIIRP